MKIYTLIEDHQLDLNFGAEHGVSFYIETAKHKVLFDVGQSSLFLSNAIRFKLDLSLVDTVIISHGHYDHGGGLEDFLRINKKAKIYIQENAFDKFYSMRKEGQYTYIGLSQKLDTSRFTMIKGDLKIDDELMIINDIKHKLYLPSSNQTMFKSIEEKMVLDDFSHEQSLIITELEHAVLFAGCAHKGILNIVDQAELMIKPQKLTKVFGGFHLKSRLKEYEETEIQIENIAHIMADKKSIIFYTGHCTGDKAFSLMKPLMADKLQVFHPGLIIDLN